MVSLASGSRFIALFHDVLQFVNSARKVFRRSLMVALVSRTEDARLLMEERRLRSKRAVDKVDCNGNGSSRDRGVVMLFD